MKKHLWHDVEDSEPDDGNRGGGLFLVLNVFPGLRMMFEQGGSVSHAEARFF